MNLSSLKRKIAEAVKKAEQMSLTNNYFIFWEGEKQQEIPDRSLVIVLTKYPEESPE